MHTTDTKFNRIMLNTLIIGTLCSSYKESELKFNQVSGYFHKDGEIF